MPMINRACDNCGLKDKPVYERYKVQDGLVMKLKRHELTGELISADESYWCLDCSKKERETHNAET